MQEQKPVNLSQLQQLPVIEPNFHLSSKDPCLAILADLMRIRLKQVLPSFFIHGDGDREDTIEDQQEYLKLTLPLIAPSAFQKPPFELSFFILSRYHPNSFKFIFEMISRWLVPGKRLNVLHFHASDFTFPELGKEVYTLMEIILEVETEQESLLVQKNLPIIETEIRLGVHSPAQAKRILEIKGLAADEKTAHIHEHIAYLTEKLPSLFDPGVFTEMQHVLVKTKDEFKALRDSKLLAKLISYHYLFRKAISRELRHHQNRRYLYLKLVRAFHLSGKSPKIALGIIIGVNFLKDKEVFEERHILKAVQNYIPDISAVEGSFFANTRINDEICTLYLEIYKNDLTPFTTEEMRFLRGDLPNDLKDRIEHLMHPIFMPRNEEEVMRNILSLSNQIRFVRDIPQVVISFDQQADPELVFTVIWVRVLKPDAEQLGEKMMQSALTYVHDRCKIVGYLRKKYPKEASVFHIKMDKEPYLRSDHSIDLYKARQTVVDELTKVLGPFRDFNGGMISKQNELLLEVRGLLSQETRYNDFLLENFFYSMNPVILRSVLPPKTFARLFQLLLDCLNDHTEQKTEPKFLKIPDYFLAMIPLEEEGIKDLLLQQLESLDLSSSNIGHTFVTVHSTPYLGCICRTKDHSIISKIQEILKALPSHR
ncbi:MAG: hypothetical protein K0S07_248 [Chlamydiales bacterium]|jgi:hypothetical protein|nr:hypothetical protein [Chlamydiales bacterium]